MIFNCFLLAEKGILNFVNVNTLFKRLRFGLSLFSLCLCRENAKINPNKKYDVLKTIEKIVNNNIRPWKSAVRCWFVGSVCIVVVLYQKLYVCCLFFFYRSDTLFWNGEPEKTIGFLDFHTSKLSWEHLFLERGVEEGRENWWRKKKIEKSTIIVYETNLKQF